MTTTTTHIILSFSLASALLCEGRAQPQASTRRAHEPVARFEFNGTLDNAAAPSVTGSTDGTAAFVRGLEGRALSLGAGDSATSLTIEGADLPFDPGNDFSVQCWIRTTAESGSRMVLLSQKDYGEGSLASQKVPSWVFYMSGGTWAWNMGSGKRRITYERDNGEHMPLNDGRWHQLTMTYDSDLAQVWLYYDGVNRVIYNVRDSTGFDFTSAQPLTVGSAGSTAIPQGGIVPGILTGVEALQQLVDAFNSFELSELESDEFARLIVEPKKLFSEKVRARAQALGAEGEAFVKKMSSVDFEPVSRAESRLMRNPYTVHQVLNFMEAAPLLKLYSLVNGKVTLDDRVAKSFSERERLHSADFDVDKLAVWRRALPAEEVQSSYSAYFEPAVADVATQLDSITTGVWNIFHGGLHFTVDKHGWDSRLAIAQIIEREALDVVMLQETYSSGDFIAAELGYYFATTVDWDYLNQGANISVISRYPIREVRVPDGAAFMNVAARVAISETQDMWVMSNWYGMDKFPVVSEFHEGRFADAATTPVFFGGDFNAIPHTDGGDSPASRVLLQAGFTDAYRSLHPDVETFPGFSHRSGRRIDQLYFKGAGLRHTSTRLINTWPTGFPSDHYLIRSVFGLR
ncbi:MAG: exonuclease III [Planctomycetota bacterium]|jgi:exonuclease III